jgi:hypothetical protein
MYYPDEAARMRDVTAKRKKPVSELVQTICSMLNTALLLTILVLLGKIYCSGSWDPKDDPNNRRLMGDFNHIVPECE